jgi:acetyl-CoA synthetase
MGDKPAIIWEPNNPEKELGRLLTTACITCCQVAQMLKNNGVEKATGSLSIWVWYPNWLMRFRLCPYWCDTQRSVWRISAQSIADRLEDAGAEYIITADGAYRGEKVIAAKGRN